MLVGVNSIKMYYLAEKQHMQMLKLLKDVRQGKWILSEEKTNQNRTLKVLWRETHQRMKLQVLAVDHPLNERATQICIADKLEKWRADIEIMGSKT